jgi:hypothetical protein
MNCANCGKRIRWWQCHYFYGVLPGYSCDEKKQAVVEHDKVVERLRENLTTTVKNRDAWLTEAERLRVENNRVRELEGDWSACVADRLRLEAEVERLKTQLAGADADRLVKRGEIERLRRCDREHCEQSVAKGVEVERLREMNDRQYDELVERERRITRLRKAVNWLRGCFDRESWEYKRATAVLDEEAE